MSDLYHIPNDDGISYRLKKFVEYQHEVPAIHYRFAGSWVNKYKFDYDRAVNMCWYMCITYNEITCVLLDELFKFTNDYTAVWRENGENLIFGSARKHVKLCGRFELLMRQWKEATKNEPYIWLMKLQGNNPTQSLKNLRAELQKFKEVSRFSTDLFVEMVQFLQNYFGFYVEEPSGFDWKNCANITSGTYNIFYFDEKANLYDKTKTVEKSEYPFLNKCLKIIQKEIHRTYPEQDCRMYFFSDKICSFRNLFKGARYGGFHHDRELEWINKYKEAYPEFKELWEKCFEMRKEIFPNHLLGEINGWNGIRKERKKLWLQKGLTGVEKGA